MVTNGKYPREIMYGGRKKGRKEGRKGKGKERGREREGEKKRVRASFPTIISEQKFTALFS